MTDTPTSAESTKKKSMLPWLVACLATVALGAVVVQVVKSGRAKREAAAHKFVTDLGAIAIRGATSKRVESLTLAAPTPAKDRVDEAIPHIAMLGELKHLDLSRTNVTDDHLKAIGKLPKLTSIALNETEVSDAGVANLARLKLQALQLANTKVTSASLDVIGEMTELTNLDLSHTDMTGSLEPLVNLTEVNWIVLGGIAIDESTIDVLSRMPALKQLSIIGTDLDASLEELLKKAKPTITIDKKMSGEVHESSANSAILEGEAAN